MLLAGFLRLPHEVGWIATARWMIRPALRPQSRIQSVVIPQYNIQYPITLSVKEPTLSTYIWKLPIPLRYSSFLYPPHPFSSYITLSVYFTMTLFRMLSVPPLRSQSPYLPTHHHFHLVVITLIAANACLHFHQLIANTHG